MKNWVLHFTPLIKLATCFLVLLCLSSAGYASPPSTDVHFCLPLDFEDMQARDSLYAATKHALNLNVGEPRTVRMIYFLPNDRPFRQEVVDSMKVTIRQIQTFYAEQTQAHGYGNKTFRFETDAEGEPMVHRVDGQHPDSHYLDNTFFTVLDEIEQVFDLDVNIYFVVIDNSTDLLAGGALGRGGRRGKTGGMGLFPGGFSWTTAAHELGHAFGLEHDFQDDRYLMSYGPGQDRLSMCHAEFLVVHPYFNSNVEVQETPSPTIELISPLGYPSGSKSIAIQLKVSDSGGIHQVIISAKTIPLHRAAGFREVKACRGLNGEQDAVVEFDYDGIIPSNGFTNLSRPAEHPISVRVIDIDGNVSRISFDLWEISPHYIATLLGHTEYVGSVVFSPDGMILASGSGDHTIRLWDVSTRTEVATLIGHTEGVSSIAFSPDGTILASGSWDHTIKLWDMTIRRNVATLEGYTGVSVSFSYDGTMLASGSWQNIQLWDVSTRTEITTLKGHTGWVFSVAFSPDGMLLASGSDDGTIKLWDVSTRTEITTLKGHTDRVYSVAFSPDGMLLASGSDDGTIKLWDVSTRTEITTLKGHTNGIYSVAFSPDGATLASGSVQDATRLWDIVTGRHLATLDGHNGQCRSVAFSPNGMMLAVGTWNSLVGRPSVVELWNVHEWVKPRPQTLVKISEDDQQGTLSTALVNPFVVEVRDQNNNPLQGAEVTFTVIAGDGKLSGRFTVENAITDANGRAQSTLTLGPHPGTNTVEATLAELGPVTFNAVAVGTPTTPVMGSDYQTWHLPDGAVVRLGKGRVGGGDRAVAFSPDSQHLAVASGIGIWLHDVATSRERALLTGHTDEVYSVAFSPDGTTLASGSFDRTVKLWNVATGENIATLEGHANRIYSVAFSPDGKMLASGSDDRTIKLWEVSTGAIIATLDGHTDEVYSVAFSPDGTTLASGSWDNTVKLWDVASRQSIATLTHTHWVYSVAYSPDGTILASGSFDRTIKLWEVSTGAIIATLEGHRSEVYSVAFSPDGTRLASGSWDNTVKLWEVSIGAIITTLDGHTSEVYSVAFSPDEKILASGSGDGTIKLWDIETHNILAFNGHTDGVISMAFSSDGVLLASRARDNKVRLWDMATKQNIAVLNKIVSENIAFSPDGKTLASGLWNTIRLWDMATRQSIVTLEGHMDVITSVAYSPDGTILASGAGDSTIRLWDVATGESIATLDGHTREITSIAFSPDGTILASGAGDSTIRLWDVATGESIATLDGHTREITSIAFSPDGTILASGAGDSIIRLWDVATQTEITTLEGHTHWIYSVAYSPDGTTLASAGWDEVRLWNIATRTNIAILEGHRDRVSSVAFLPYSITLASGSDDGTILLWDMSQYITPVVYIPDANLHAVIRDALSKSRFAPITVTDMASLTTLDASSRNIRDLTGLEFATNLTELNLVDNRLSSLSINTHIPALQDRGVEVLFDKTPTPDFDGDGVVGFADFLLFVAQFGFSEDDEGYDVWFDLDGDGTIGFGDFLIFANAFGKVISSN